MGVAKKTRSTMEIKPSVWLTAVSSVSATVTARNYEQGLNEGVCEPSEDFPRTNGCACLQREVSGRAGHPEALAPTLGTLCVVSEGARNCTRLGVWTSHAAGARTCNRTHKGKQDAGSRHSSRSTTREGDRALCDRCVCAHSVLICWQTEIPSLAETLSKLFT